MLQISEVTIIRSDRRTISLRIEPDGSLILKAPQYVSEKQINTFIKERQDWIEKHLAKMKKRVVQARKEGEYLFLGQTLTLQPGNYLHMTVEKEKLLFPQALLFRKEKELTAWYIKQAKEIITRQVEKYAAEMNTSVTNISFSDTKSKWGSCTHDNRLQFNWRLVMAPLLVIRYVVIHELAHTMEKNHNQFFWMKVRNYNPSYKQQIKWLKDYGHTLTIEG